MKRSLVLIRNYLKAGGFFWPGMLVLFVLIIIFANYRPGTWLSGWDTLHPEFDFALNIKRVVFGVFRQEQGLGAVAGHSHMSDLPRIIFLYISSFVIPADFLRYSYFFITLLLGPLGVYFFLERVVIKDKLAAFSGALFYLLNLGTLQHFYVPFEMFATLYATLPWLFLFASKFLIEKIKTKKYLLLFCLASLLATPMAYAATLWYVYFLSLVIYLTTLFCFGQKNRQSFSKLLVLFLVTLAINSYWLLPNIYFIKNYSADVSSSKINQDFSKEAYAYDTKYANLENVSILRGFLFDWKQYKDYKSDYLLKDWRDYLKNPLIVFLGSTFFGIIVFGLFISIATKDKFGLVFMPIFGLSFIFLIHNQPPLNQLFDFIRERSTVLSEVSRFPWTKFSIIVMFSYAFYFSKGIFVFLTLLKKIRFARLVIGILVSASLIIWMLPAFSGQFISPSMKVNIPNDYFDTFDYFASQPEDKRIAVFPASSFRGWEYYNWGFEGAGFIWFGLKQPVLVRDFDRWNPKNENYYWEISYAVYSKNSTLFEKVLQKYQISYLLVDESVIDPAFPKAVYTDELENMLSASTKISLAQIFGKIKIYKVHIEAPVNDFVFLAENLPTVGPVYKWNNFDKGYSENGPYVSSANPDIYYPFGSLFTGKNQEDLEFSVEEKADSFVFKKDLPDNMGYYFLKIPPIETDDLQWVDPNDLSKIKNLPKEVRFNGKSVEVTVPKVGGLYSYNMDAGVQTEFTLSNLPHNIGYLITVKSENISGKPLKFWIENLNSRKADFETYLLKQHSIFIQPPMEKDGLGYILHFDQVNFSKIKIYPIPFDFLTGLVLKKANTINLTQLSSVSVNHPNPNYYTVSLPANLTNQTLILSQSFENGWRAYEGTPFISRELKHVLVNNWENGWLIESNKGGTITIFYWPQLLEWGGFILVIGTFLFVFFKKIS